MNPPTRRSMRLSIAITAVLLLLALIPLPGNRARAILRSIRSLEPNNADRESHAGGYYVGLIDGGPDSGRDELTLRLLGKTSDWKGFHEIDATRYLRDDFLQFELKPNEDKVVFGKRLTTNDRGLRDRPYATAKPEGTYRIALLGSSMDMGWGVATDETYENRLEDWLNAHAARRGIARRFEVINFAMAAYSPLHRLESFRRKARDYQPDLVLYSATMLDARLLEIHLRNMLRQKLDPQYGFLRDAIAAMGVSAAELEADKKDVVKSKVRPYLWPLIDATLGDLAARCRSEDYGLAMIVVPRVGESDSPEARGPAVEEYAAMAARHAVSLLDLSATFDDRDPATIEIAAWDDHPNALGHKLLFQALARGLVQDESLYQTIFGIPRPTDHEPPTR